MHRYIYIHVQMYIHMYMYMCIYTGLCRGVFKVINKYIYI